MIIIKIVAVIMIIIFRPQCFDAVGFAVGKAYA